MKIRFLFLLIFIYNLNYIYASDTIRIVSYNVENLFDCKHDSLKNDYDYLPKGKYHYTENKYRKKIGHLCRVISSINGLEEAPAIVGLCEVENEKVLIRLTKYSPLKNLHYKYVHQESPDKRGVDVALLYLPNKFRLLNKNIITVKYPFNNKDKTRDIIYVKGVLRNGDTLNIFMVHAPSRLGGEFVSESKRIYVSSLIRFKVDSLFQISSKANIVIMGDFNDYPNNKSVNKIIGAVSPSNNIRYNGLYNLLKRYDDNGEIGSNKYQGQWGVLDQIIVSGNLLNSSSKTHTYLLSGKIYAPEYLMCKDKTFGGIKPFRSYSGFRYIGGYSDHLPVYFDLVLDY